MTPNDEKVLKSLDRGHYHYGEFGGLYYHFSSICEDTGIDRRNVRLSCRRLSRKGLAEYSNALTTEDGELAGAGYAITEKGHRHLQGS